MPRRSGRRARHAFAPQVPRTEGRRAVRGNGQATPGWPGAAHSYYNRDIGCIALRLAYALIGAVVYGVRAG